MKNALLLIVFAIALVFLSPSLTSAQRENPTKDKPATAKATDWRKFVSQEGKFSVLVPTEPKVLSQDFFQAFGKATVFTYVIPLDGDKASIGVNAQTPYPPLEGGHTFSEYQQLRFLREHLVKGTVIQLKDISQRGVPAIEWSALSPFPGMDGWITYARAYYVMSTHRMYIVSFNANGDEAYKRNSKEADRFFESFTTF